MLQGCCEPCACNPCDRCCSVNPAFWFFVLGISAIFLALWLIFTWYPGQLTQFRGGNGSVYDFKSSDSSSTLLILKDGTTIGQCICIPASDVQALEVASCRGTNLLWILLVLGFVAGLGLLSWINCDPDRFVCCNLRKHFEREPVELANVVELSDKANRQ